MVAAGACLARRGRMGLRIARQTRPIPGRGRAHPRTHKARNKQLNAPSLAAPPRPQVGFFDDKVGPITLAGITMITLIAITVMAFIDVFQ